MDHRRQAIVALPRGARPTRCFVLLVAAGMMMLSACSGAGDELLDSAADGLQDAGSVKGDDATAGGVDGGVEESLAFDDGLGSDAQDGPTAEDLEIDPIEIAAEDLPDIPLPEQLIPEVESSLPDVPDGDEILDTINPVDAETRIAIDRDGRTRNEAGELVGLDKPASLACANVEISLTALDGGDEVTAADGVATAAAYAEQSAMASVNEWAPALAGSIVDGRIDDYAPLIGFLTACASGGYEL